MSRLLQLWRAARAGSVVRPPPPVRPFVLPDFVGDGAPQIAVGESLGWLNSTFSGLWPNVNAAVQKIMHEQVTQQFQESMPSMFRNAHFSEFTLGTVPPVLGPVRVYQMDDSLRMTLGISYESDVEISLQVGVMSVGVKTLRFSGELVVRLEQLLNEVPVVGGIVIYFLNPPRIDFTLTGLGMGAEIPGLRGLIRRSLDNAVSSNLVLPNQIALPLGTEAQGVDRAELMIAKPLGLLRVTAVRAEGLSSPDWEGAGKEAADAYVVVKSADQRWESSTVEGSQDPEWPEESGDLFVYDHEQRIWASVFDHDHMETTDFLGASKDHSIREVLQSDGAMMLHSTEHAEDDDDLRGELTMRFRFLEFVLDELCGDKLVLCVKVDTLSLPPHFAGRAQLIARIDAAGLVKATSFGREAVRHEGSVVVSDLLRDVVVRAAAKGLSVEDIAEITALDGDDVDAVLGGGEVAEDAVLAKTRRLVHVESCLFLAFPAELMEEGVTVELEVADKKGTVLASEQFSLSTLTEDEHFSSDQLLEMPCTDEGEDSVEAHVRLTLMGTREADHEW